MLVNLRFVVCLILVMLAGRVMAQAPAKKAERLKPSAEHRRRILTETADLQAEVNALRDRKIHEDQLCDIAIYAKAAAFMDRFDEYSDKGDAETVLEHIATGRARATSAREGKTPWTSAVGSVVCGYRSEVDGSVQPYAVEVPSNLVRGKPARLDVVLHGRNAGLNGSRFIKSHEGKKVPEDRPGLTLHVFGRTNNAYRWAGETDVFEAIKAVKRNYRVDDDRIVLRGFSMGGAGAWHLALHYPALWCSVEAGAGFTDTWRHGKLDPKTLPVWRINAAHIYDSVDYALNAFGVPIIAYGGENDPQLQASTNIIEALKRQGVSFRTEGLVTTAEGLDFRRVVGKAMGHKVDPASEALMKAFHDEHARAGINRTPRKIRFVTHSLAYHTAAWLSVERMSEGDKRTTVEAELGADLATITTVNVAVLAVDRQVAQTVKIDGKELPLRPGAKGLLPQVYYRKTPEGWIEIDHETSFALTQNLDGFKSPTLHGPIDDAFRESFVVVVPSKEPWQPRPADWANRRLADFQATWGKQFRGDVRVKRDTDVSESDIAEHHLILFGDPGSNVMLAKVLKGLPIEWSRESFKLGRDYPSRNHLPILIAPNPLNPKRYVVVNSGPTFKSSDFDGTNALLFPHLGDWAVIDTEAVNDAEAVVTSGEFNQRWQLP